MARSPWSWLGRLPPVALDAAAVTVLLLLGLGGLLGRELAWPVAAGDRALLAALLLLQTLPLLLRRRWPVSVLVCVVGAFVGSALLGGRSTATALGVLLAIYSVAVYGERVRRMVIGGVGLVALVAGLAAYLVAGAPPTLAAPGVAFTAAWLLGDYIRTRRAYLAELEARAQRADRDREEDRRRAADEERARIARELHDVVSHHVSVIAVQAGAARVAQDGDPGLARRTLATIEATARQAQVELNRLLGVLRRPDAAAPREPQPGLGELDPLLARAREAGMDVRLVVSGRPRTLPEALDTSAYRIVQEAVTNAMKHARFAHVEVQLRYGAQELEVRVADDGKEVPGTPEGSAGQGIAGMRERVALFGGELDAGPRAGGGFQVTAHLPLEATGS
jgi:signal transduction histidine kinase